MSWREVDAMYQRIHGTLSHLGMPDDEIRGIAQSMIDAGCTPEAHAAAFSAMVMDPDSETAGGVRGSDLMTRWETEMIDVLVWAAGQHENRKTLTP